MGVDGGDYSLRGKRSVEFGSDVCRAGFLCETARGDFRFGDSIENGARQSRAPLRAVARTRTPAERPVSLEAELVTRHRAWPPWRVTCHFFQAFLTTVIQMIFIVESRLSILACYVW